MAEGTSGGSGTRPPAKRYADSRAQAQVLALQRFPVKSMLGEAVTSLASDERGCAGDRRWSVRTAAGKIGSGKDTRRFAAVIGLLDLRAQERDGRVVVVFPDGTECAASDDGVAERISRYVGQPVTLAEETSVSHFDDGPVSLVGRASVDALSEARGELVDARRFRANILLDTSVAFAEDAWVGHDVAIGSVVLRIAMRSPRCVMVNMQSADLPVQPGNLAAIGRLNDTCLGVIATVVTPGTVTVGDPVTLRRR
jgi:uncharacterized protein YcbX